MNEPKWLGAVDLAINRSGEMTKNLCGYRERKKLRTSCCEGVVVPAGVTAGKLRKRPMLSQPSPTLATLVGSVPVQAVV